MAESEDVGQEAEIAARLVRDIRAGARAAEAEMIARYSAGLLFLLNRRARDAELARDLRQDTFRVAIEKLRAEPIEQPERLGAYLRGVALNLLMAQRRKDTRRATSADSTAVESAPDAAAGPFEHVSSAQIQRAVAALLAELRTPRDREILTRLYLEDADKDDICAALDIDSTHFNRVLFRAKQRFRELLTRGGASGRLRVVG